MWNTESATAIEIINFSKVALPIFLNKLTLLSAVHEQSLRVNYSYYFAL